MRWQHPSGDDPPDRFIPLAEDSGLIVPMTRLLMAQVRETVCRQGAPSAAEGSTSASTSAPATARI